MSEDLFSLQSRVITDGLDVLCGSDTMEDMRKLLDTVVGEFWEGRDLEDLDHRHVKEALRVV